MRRSGEGLGLHDQRIKRTYKTEITSIMISPTATTELRWSETSPAARATCAFSDHTAARRHEVIRLISTSLPPRSALFTAISYFDVARNDFIVVIYDFEIPSSSFGDDVTCSDHRF